MASVHVRENQRKGENHVKMETKLGVSHHKTRHTDSQQKLEEARNRILYSLENGALPKL